MRRILVIIVTFLILGCSSKGQKELTIKTIKFAKDNNLKVEIIKTNNFSLFSLHKFQLRKKNVTVYIEGDGFAWVNRHRISNNPTPRSNLVIKLASIDQNENIIYLARPCQHIDLKTQSQCNYKYWTSHRFSSKVISSYNEALNYLKNKYKIDSFSLIGYSGGGAIASLLASKRNDILSLRTIAGNLDHRKLNSTHHVSQMPHSLNAIDYIDQLKEIPQIHFCGAKDKIVYPWITVNFVEKQKETKCAKYYIIQNATHNTGWEQQWHALSLMRPNCN